MCDTPAMATLNEMPSTWEEVIARWQRGENWLPPDLQRWRASYEGRGRGAVGLEAIPEPYRLLRIVRRSSGSVMTWRRAWMVLCRPRGMDVTKTAEVAFTSPDRVREVLHNFNDDGFDSL